MSDDLKPEDGWMPLEEYCAKHGERKNTIHKRITDDLWIRGEHFSSPTGGACFVHEERAQEWLRLRGKTKALA